MKKYTGKRTIPEIEWTTWRGVDPATLVFVVEKDQVLLIRKKRGLGAGKINGPGGRFEPKETAIECAIRETKEEVGIHPTGMSYRGENLFQFVDGYSIHVHVFVADGYVGEVGESDEALPIWTPLASIPYDEMWEDDRLWLPIALAGKQRFKGVYIFDGDSMLDHHLELLQDSDRSLT